MTVTMDRVCHYLLQIPEDVDACRFLQERRETDVLGLSPPEQQEAVVLFVEAVFKKLHKEPVITVDSFLNAIPHLRPTGEPQDDLARMLRKYGRVAPINRFVQEAFFLPHEAVAAAPARESKASLPPVDSIGEDLSLCAEPASAAPGLHLPRFTTQKERLRPPLQCLALRVQTNREKEGKPSAAAPE